MTDEQIKQQWAAQAEAMHNVDPGRTILMRNLHMLAGLPLTQEERDQINAIVQAAIGRARPPLGQE
jgi:hypothetical protein